MVSILNITPYPILPFLSFSIVLLSCIVSFCLFVKCFVANASFSTLYNLMKLNKYICRCNDPYIYYQTLSIVASKHTAYHNKCIYFFKEKKEKRIKKSFKWHKTLIYWGWLQSMNRLDCNLSIFRTCYMLHEFICSQK